MTAGMESAFPSRHGRGTFTEMEASIGPIRAAAQTGTLSIDTDKDVPS